MNEDCLYLNVWTPARNGNEKLPVIFWVHGGGFMTGYGHSAHFDGEHFARQGVILVTINYRLNIFGWLTHPELSAESEHHVSGNYGLLDQVFALKWTKRNIAAFGGDPDNITIAGQSAGAMSIQNLLTTPMTKGLVAKAIMQSGGGVTAMPDMRYPTLVEAEAQTDLSLLGVSSIAEARSLPWEELLKRWIPNMFQTGLTRMPVIDGWALPASLDDMARTGDYRHVPCLIGYTSDEGIAPMGVSGYEDYRPIMEREYGPRLAGEFLSLCTEEYSEYAKRCCTEHVRASAEAWALRLERDGNVPGYIYCLNRKLPGDQMGAFHAADLWYVFGTLMRAWRPWEKEDYWLAYACNTYWAQFAKTGIPQGDRLPPWLPYTTGSSQTMELGTDIGMVELPWNPRVEFRKKFLLG